MKVTSEDRFIMLTSLRPRVIAKTTITQHEIQEKVRISDPQKAYFEDHVNEKLIYLFEHNPIFKKRINSKRGRDFAYSFVNQCLEKYLQNPEDYQFRQTQLAS